MNLKIIEFNEFGKSKMKDVARVVKFIMGRYLQALEKTPQRVRQCQPFTGSLTS